MSADGLARAGDGGARQIDVPVLLVVTDRRLVFAAVRDEPVETETIAFEYNELASVETRGDDGRMLEVMTVSRSNWQYRLPADEPAEVDTIRRHLSWVGAVRRRVVGMRNDVEFAAGEIRDAAREMEWTVGEKRYEDARRSLDGLIGAVQRTTPIDDDVLAPELTDIERTLERAAAWLSIERAESQLELGRQLVRTENYGQAQKVLSQARTHYETAIEHGDAVRRGDAFQFGEQRDLQEALDRIRWEIDTVAVEPIRQAHEAKIQAQNADVPETAVEYWEVAFRRYGQVLTMNWDTEGGRAGGRSIAVYDELESAAESIVSLRCSLARACWEAGISSRQSGEPKAALRSCSDAEDHLERAHELAIEFHIGDTDVIATRLERIHDVLADVRETAAVPDRPVGDGKSVEDGSTSTDGGDATDEGENSTVASADETRGATIDRELPSAAELSALNTHQEMRLELEKEPVGTPETGRSEPERTDGSGERDAESVTTE